MFIVLYKVINLYKMGRKSDVVQLLDVSFLYAYMNPFMCQQNQQLSTSSYNLVGLLSLGYCRSYRVLLA